MGGRRVAGFGSTFLLKTFLWGSVLLAWVTLPAEAAAPDNADFDRFRVIAEKSMFGRHRTADPKAETQSRMVSETIPADIKLVGIVRLTDPLSSIAIIEVGGKHRLCRVGDQVETLILRSIRNHDIVFETSSGQWLAEIEPGTTVRHVTAPQPDPSAPGFVAAPQEPASGARRLPVRAIDIKQLAKAGLVTYRENGVVRGLQLTRDALGLKEGDRVTYVDGQALCIRRPKQKLWQIVRKHSASKEHVGEIHVVVERNERTLEFLVTPIG
jgi:type II secretory pathway component PulC